jgi:long-chain acyl-CoA synthetase
MTQLQQLLERSSSARQEFMGLPLLQETLRRGAEKSVYLDFLGQAYHHVKHTAPLLALAASRCGPDDGAYQADLFEYIDEERGHEEWILDDIKALGADAQAVRRGSPRLPCKMMVAYAYYLIERVSPYGLLGMVHVLEGMSVTLAGRAVTAIRGNLRIASEAGFKYLTTHSDLDTEHTKRFEILLNGIEPRHLPLVIESACDFYSLYGAIFTDIDERRRIDAYAA